MIPVFLILAAALECAPVPDGGGVLVNGFVGEGEWASSCVICFDKESEIRFHKDAGSLYIAIVFNGPRHSGVDLYLESGGRTRMLHVSSALGEKELEKGAWSDLAWGGNSWWTANAIQSVWENDGTRYLEPEAFEFQIDRRELGSEALLFLHLKRPEKLLPPGASEADSGTWLRLDLAPAARETPEDRAAQVRAAETAFAATMAARDFEAFKSFVAEDAVFFGSRGVLRGREAVAAGWQRFFEGAAAPFSWAPETVEVLESGILALSSGPVRDLQGKRIGTFNSVWRREADGRWRIVFDKGCPPCESAQED